MSIFNIGSSSHSMDRPFQGHTNPLPVPSRKKRTIDEILACKTNDAKLIVLRANELEYAELNHSISNKLINLWFVGSLNNFEACTKLIWTDFKLDLYSKETEEVIMDLGVNKLIEVEIEAPDNKRLTIRLTWER